VVAAGSMPEVADRADFDVYARNYKLDEDLLSRFKLGTPEPGDRADLPKAVSGTMETTYWWLSDDALNDYWFPAPPPELETRPEWMAADLVLDDPRLVLEDYEVLLNADYFQLDANDALMAGLGRGRTADGGGWSGQVRGFTDPDEPAFAAGRHLVMTLKGTGSYKGLSAILFAHPDPATEEEALASSEEEILDSWSVEGMLFVGASPPYPEAP
jgi:hypothetical protein